ncbi:hypothetical protein GIB67_033530 [Kingdonia uniflora]|uniref:Uncharacterized protein n=1 Tax=Kingdonia uniflora TaxID=39325 RepID=A0A7J7L648_9MAGN|nr:hypothetical protein GIB67_033530 [Kingdonia uniflora]
MGRSSANEVSTSGRSNESNRKGERGLEQFLGFPSQLVSYPPIFYAFREFCKAKGAIRGVKSTVERKESLLDEVAEEETELELVLGELGLSRKKRVESNLKKFAKAQYTRLMTGVDEGARQTSGEEIRAKTPGLGSSAQGDLTTGKIAQRFPKRQIKTVLPTSVDDLKENEERARLTTFQGKEDTSQMVARLVKGIWLGIEEQKSELKKAKSWLEKNLTPAKTDAMKEVKQLKAAHATTIGHLQVEAKANLDETAEERDRLGRHLMLKGNSHEEAINEMSLRINDLEYELSREIETSKALLSVLMEL